MRSIARAKPKTNLQDSALNENGVQVGKRTSARDEIADVALSFRQNIIEIITKLAYIKADVELSEFEVRYARNVNLGRNS